MTVYPHYMYSGLEAEPDEEHADGGSESRPSGLAILAKGLPEYGVIDDEERTYALTLLRTYRFPIIGADPENVAPDPFQVGGQCLREFTFDYAILPYQGHYLDGAVKREAEFFNVKMRAAQAGKTHGAQPLALSMLELNPKQLVLTAVKKEERGDGVVVRLYNPTDEAIEGEVTFFRPPALAAQVNMNEKDPRELKVSGNGVRLSPPGDPGCRSPAFSPSMA
jgi:alpha-mannosidase